MMVNGVSPARPTRAVRARPEEDIQDMVLSEFDAPRLWLPAGELTLITAGVFLLVALLAWLF
jgi:hypothetical protein